MSQKIRKWIKRKDGVRQRYNFAQVTLSSIEPEFKSLESDRSKIEKIKKGDKSKLLSGVSSLDPDKVDEYILLLYDKQTFDEQLSRDTIDKNKRGFNLADAKKMSVYAERFLKGGHLEPSEMKMAREELKKYKGQLKKILTYGSNPNLTQKDIDAINGELRKRLGDRLVKTKFVGSRTTGKSKPDSDYDVVVVLKKDDKYKNEKYPLQKQLKDTDLELGKINVDGKKIDAILKLDLGDSNGI